MAGLYSHTTRATGLTLTAAIYNADHENHITNHVPAQMDDYSSTVGEMQTQTDPGEQGTESQATALSEELERIRYAINEIKKTTIYWYETHRASSEDNVAAELFSASSRIKNHIGVSANEFADV